MGFCTNNAMAQTIVGEGDECQETVSPVYQTRCDIGLECVTPGIPGAPGTCQYAAEGEECFPTVSPEYQLYCAEGFECVTPPGVLGASGVCEPIAMEPEPEPDRSQNLKKVHSLLD